MHPMAGLAQRTDKLCGDIGKLAGLRIIDDENVLQFGFWLLIWRGF